MPRSSARVDPWRLRWCSSSLPRFSNDGPQDSQDETRFANGSRAGSISLCRAWMEIGGAGFVGTSRKDIVVRIGIGEFVISCLGIGSFGHFERERLGNRDLGLGKFSFHAFDRFVRCTTTLPQLRPYSEGSRLWYRGNRVKAPFSRWRRRCP